MADFTPELQGYNKPGAFRFWCQKVLPLVYDDSLSYYELLNKVVDYLNHLIEDNQATIDNVGSLLTAYNQLQGYVNDYFANLDVQNEVNVKLDEMAEDGSLTELIAAYVDPLVTAQNNRITAFENTVNGNLAEQTEYNNITRGMLANAYSGPYPVSTESEIPDGESNVVWVGATGTGASGFGWKQNYWYYTIKENGSLTFVVEGGLYQASGVQTDKTLTIPDMAADAQVTGQKITDLKEDLDTNIAIIYGDNLLSVPTETVNIAGVTYVSDGNTVIANGTPNVNSIYRMRTFNAPMTGDYRLAGCPAGGALNRYYMRLGEITGNDTGNGVIVHLTKNATYTVWVVVYASYTVSDLEFTPSLTIQNAINFESISARLDRIDEVLTPIPLYGAYSDATGAISVGNNFSTLLYSGRTNIAFIKAGSKISNMSGINTVLSIYRYRSYDINTFIEHEQINGTTFSKTFDQDGYYAFAVRRNDYAKDTPENLFALLTFDLAGHYSDSIDITFMDTGAGVSEATFVVFPNGKNLLIDSGFKSNYTSLQRLIYTKGYKSINNFILSHYHNDHVGGIIESLNRGILSLDGANVYLPDQNATQWAYDNNVMEETTKLLYVEFNTLLENINCNIIYPATEYENYAIGDAIISFFNTDLSVYEGLSTNYNDWSLCNYIFYGNNNACFTGDIGPIAENQLARKLYKAKIYKAEHHGWANTTTIPNNYIDYVSPEVIISCDGAIHDEYLLGDRAPLEAWAEEFCVPYYRTYQNGDINISMTKDSWEIKTIAKRYLRAHNPLT